jgi:hypothetical protein
MNEKYQLGYYFVIKNGGNIINLSPMKMMSWSLNYFSSQKSLNVYCFQEWQSSYCAFHWSQSSNTWLRTHKLSRYHRSWRTATKYCKCPTLTPAPGHSCITRYWSLLGNRWWLDSLKTLIIRLSCLSLSYWAWKQRSKTRPLWFCTIRGPY